MLGPAGSLSPFSLPDHVSSYLDSFRQIFLTEKGLVIQPVSQISSWNPHGSPVGPPLC